ncbi:MAG: SO_0444 family Cu/Zn efflux transporter [Desulfovibrionaceae bacterium]
MEWIIGIASASWEVLRASAPYMLLGFAMAGLLKAFLPDDFVTRHLGGGGTGSVLKAAVLGIPLPLCSCGVIAAAAGLRGQGAGKGATASFLIATPETGVDSIAVTYGLLDPLMAVFRPLAAFVTALTAGVLINATDKGTKNPILPMAPCAPGCARDGHAAPRRGVAARLRGGMGYAFGELLPDIGAWFLLGVAIAGAITTLIPDAFIERYLGGGLLPMLIMLAAGIPMYVCATASTPIAAALALKGMSPGAALVFLLSGPATNAATITVVSRLLGRRAAAIYVGSIAACALALGVAADALYAALGLGVGGWATDAALDGGTWLATPAAFLLLGLMLAARLGLFGGHAHGHGQGQSSGAAPCGCGCGTGRK